MNAAPSPQAEIATCAKHGEYEPVRTRFSPIPLGCLKCCEEERAEQDRLQQEQDRRERIIELTAGAEIPPKFARASLDGAPPKIAAWLTSAIEGESAGPLVLIGPVGVGKTFAACGALRRFVADTTRAARYITAPGYGRAVRNTWGRVSEHSETQLLHRYGKASFLVLDEFGASRDVDASMLQDLIGARYDAGLMPKTIIVSNLGVTKFAEAAGERAADRIREGCTVCAMTGASRRNPAP